VNLPNVSKYENTDSATRGKEEQKQVRKKKERSRTRKHEISMCVWCFVEDMIILLLSQRQHHGETSWGRSTSRRKEGRGQDKRAQDEK